jgi:hypothetical protein
MFRSTSTSSATKAILELRNLLERRSAAFEKLPDTSRFPLKNLSEKEGAVHGFDRDRNENSAKREGERS